MKIQNIFKAFAALLAVGSLASCQNSFDDPGLVVPVAKMQANTTLAEFKDAFKDKPNQLCPYKDEETKTPYIIKGRVVSTDVSGNIYKALYIQDETAALTFSINRAAMYEFYHVGQEIVVDLTGLWVGKYNNMLQIGWLDYSTTYNEDQMGRMDFSVFQTHVELNGLPEPEVTYVAPTGARPEEGIYCVVDNLDDIPKLPSDPEFYNMQGQLVEFRNVSFVEGGEATFSKYQSSGENQNLTQEGNTALLTVRTSGYAMFYNDVLPTGTGTVRGILSYYASDPTSTNQDNTLNGWQLLLRTIDDVMFDDKGTKEEPYTVAEAIGLAGQGRNGWVKGYVVGSVKAGHTVSSNDDIIFSDQAELDNNIVLAAEPTVKDWTQCISVELPQGSDLRKYANLLDNPSVYGQEISVSGSITEYLEMPGIKGTGDAASFDIPGVTPSPEPGPGEDPEGLPNGDGTEAKPYSAVQVSAMETANSVNLYTGVWATGYIVGYVDTGIKSYATDESVKFEAPATVATNLLLANTPDERDYTKCMSVNLPSGSASRTALNLKDNPGNLGKLLTIKGNITRYVGLSGLKEPTEFNLGEGGGGDTPVTPPATGTTIYEGLSANATGWTFDEITVPSAATKGLWQWDSQYGVLKASAFISNTAYESLGYAISPEIDLSGMTGATASFEQAAKFQTTLKTLCGFVVREAGSSTWTELTIPTWPASGTWNASSSGDIDLKAFAGKKIQVGFKYASSAAGADTWQIKNLKITGTK